MATTKTAHEVHEIDGLFVPCTVAGDDGAGQGFAPGTVTYWGEGYLTRDEAEACLRAVGAGGTNPPGVRVDHGTGRCLHTFGRTPVEHARAVARARAEEARLAAENEAHPENLITFGGEDD